MAQGCRTVRVNLPDHPYDVLVEPGLLRRAGAILSTLTRSRKVALVTDSTVGPLHAGTVEGSLREAGFEVIRATIPAGEDHKALADLGLIYDQLLLARVERTTPVLALGGGVVGDMTGFAAASILRGVPFVQVPTTLLSMVDASVGGKTGINHPVGKNLIGAFHQPMAVLIDPAVLGTLPARELQSGLAECIKHDVIRGMPNAELRMPNEGSAVASAVSDPSIGFAHLERNIGRALSLDIGYLAELVAHNVAIKARVVEADPFEKGERAHLNFGHTFGHAIETVSHYSYAHGECVGLGMAAAAYAAVKLGMLDRGSYERIVGLIAAAGLPTGGLTLDVGRVVEAMAFDKKVKAGKIRFVLPDRIGHVVIRDDLPGGLVTEAVESLRG